MLVKTLSIVSLMLYFTCLSEVVAGKKKPEESREGSILREYFNKLHVEVDSYNQDWVKLYDRSIIDAMQAKLQSDDDEYAISATLNKKIYVNELDKIRHGELMSPQLSPDELAALMAIELIIPNEEFKPAIEDLKKFVQEQPKLGSELLKRLVTDLDQERLDYEAAQQRLNGFYLRWIPLGRLNLFIEEMAMTANKPAL